MLLPTRCYTCGKVVGNLWDSYEKMVQVDKVPAGEALDRLGLRRYCCRRMLLSHVDMADRLLRYGTGAGNDDNGCVAVKPRM